MCSDWTIHSSPSPAYPSYRLITALRLGHISVSSADCTEGSGAALHAWRDTTLGRRQVVSEENEAGWRATLVKICEIVAQRAGGALNELENKSRDGGKGEDRCEWDGWMMGNMRLLWAEEREVARAVMQSVERGDEF